MLQLSLRNIGDVEEKEETVIPEEAPSLDEIIEKGAPPEYIPLLVISFMIVIFVIVLLVRAVNQHRRFMTKFTMQALCTMGVIFTFPVYAVMYFSGMVIPKAMSKVTFIAETYEAISLLFFLRLILTYMGGKKQTTAVLTDHEVKLNSPPLCCFVCLPKVTFSRKFLYINEAFIIQLFLLQLVLGYIDLLIGLDQSHNYPAALIEQQYSHYFHIFIIFSLLLAVYGLGGIYHSAEEELKHYDIFKKFILFKAFVTIVKFEELIVSGLALYYKDLASHKNLASGAFLPGIRIHLWCYFIVMLETAAFFPFLLKVYSIADYPDVCEIEDVELVQISQHSNPPEVEEGTDMCEVEDVELVQISQHSDPTEVEEGTDACEFEDVEVEDTDVLETEQNGEEQLTGVVIEQTRC